MNESISRPTRIAVVEDEDELRELIVDDLNSRGNVALGFVDAAALYRHLSVHSVDIVVLDIGLPGEDGFNVASHLRQLATVGIVMLSARTSSGSMQRGYSEGADVYLTKPIDYDLLHAATANLYRRLIRAASALVPSKVAKPDDSPCSTWALADGGWTLQAPSGATLSLSDQERILLSLLFKSLGEPVSRPDLVEALTDTPRDFDPHRLDALVYRLRNRVREVCGQPLPIRSVRGTGYVLASPHVS